MNKLTCNYCFYQHFGVNKTRYGYRLTCLQCGEVRYVYTRKRFKELDKAIRYNGGVI